MVASGSTSLAEASPPAILLEDKVAFLSEPGAYAGTVRSIESLESHMSFVFLVDGLVYKLKKPVRFPYLDFSTLERRAAACRAEYRLNRRLARHVYLAVVPLTVSPSGLAIDGDGAVVDWLVVMRRLDAESNLESAVLARCLAPPDADRVAATLKHFYRRARRVRMLPERYVADWRHAADYNRRVLCDPRFNLPAGRIARIVAVLRAFLADHAVLLERRVRAGRIIDAHGDLRPEHIWLTNPVMIIDCLEFDPRLRALDPLDEVAFLHLECERLGAAWVGERIRRRLSALLGEDRSSGLFLFYRIQRAMMRARLSIAHLLDATPRTPEKWPRQARGYLQLAAIDATQLEGLLKRRGGP